MKERINNSMVKIWNCRRLKYLDWNVHIFAMIIMQNDFIKLHFKSYRFMCDFFSQLTCSLWTNGEKWYSARSSLESYFFAMAKGYARTNWGCTCQSKWWIRLGAKCVFIFGYSIISFTISMLSLIYCKLCKIKSGQRVNDIFI